MRKTTSSVFKYTHKPSSNKQFQIKSLISDHHLNPEVKEFSTKINLNRELKKEILYNCQSKNNLHTKPLEDEDIKEIRRKKHHKHTETTQFEPIFQSTSIMLIQEESPVKHDIQIQYMYHQTISEYLLSKEVKYVMRKDFMKHQYELTDNDRKSLVEWIIQVHHSFKLNIQTLFLAINIMDRTFDRCIIQKNQLLLLGLSALSISSKIQQIQAPNINSFLRICRPKDIVKQDVLKMQSMIVTILEFDFGYSSPLNFINLLLIENLMLDTNIELDAFYLCKLNLLSSKMCKYKPSILSLVIFFISCKRQKVALPLSFQKRINDKPLLLNEFAICKQQMIQLIFRTQNGNQQHVLNLIRNLQ